MRWLIVTIVILAAIAFAGFLGYLYPLNNVIPHLPDNSCTQDSDCSFLRPEDATCTRCDSCLSLAANDSQVLAVNKLYEPLCPLPHTGGCAACIGGINPDGTVLKCIDNRCHKA